MSPAAHKLVKRALKYYLELNPELRKIRLDEYSAIMMKMGLKNDHSFKPWDEAALHVLRHLVLNEPLRS